MHVYSEIEPFPALWLENLIDAGELPPGRVLGDIHEITADEVLDAEQVHFFAGLGGWPLALRNPAFVRWLMGYPVAWAACAPTGTRSSPK